MFDESVEGAKVHLGGLAKIVLGRAQMATGEGLITDKAALVEHLASMVAKRDEVLESKTPPGEMYLEGWKAGYVDALAFFAVSCGVGLEMLTWWDQRDGMLVRAAYYYATEGD
jgi:hypothetical protein